MSRSGKEIEAAVRGRIASTIKQLLEEKHLYQSLTIERGEFEKLISQLLSEYEADEKASGPRVRTSPLEALFKGDSYQELLNKRLSLVLDGPWGFQSETNSLPGAEPLGWNPIALPSIRISCGSSICKSSIQPHNSGFIGLQNEIGSYELSDEPKSQCFSLPYQCQNCKGEPLIFLVKRVGLKLAISGRSQLSEVLVPKCIPGNISGFYKKAIIANQTGFVLAGALYLRVLVEQHFHAVIPPDKLQAIKGNPTGDELADFYAETLPVGFPASFPSLKKAYADLSKIIHTGKENDEVKKVFQSVISAVEGHFEAVQVFKKFTI